MADSPLQIFGEQWENGTGHGGHSRRMYEKCLDIIFNKKTMKKKKGELIAEGNVKEGWTWNKYPDYPTQNLEPHMGEIATVNLPVNVLFEWSSFIPDEVDENGKVISYKAGWIMKVIPEQVFVYNNHQKTTLAYACINP